MPWALPSAPARFFGVTMYIMAAVGIFIAMGLMRMTYRMSRRQRPDGVRWRGIDWDRAKRQEDADEEDA
jgi:hypothetical protein